MGVADDQYGAIALTRGDHLVTVGKRQRHRLLYEYVFAMSRGHKHVLTMHLVRRGNKYDLDIGMDNKLLGAGHNYT